MNKESIVAIIRIVVPAVCGVAGVLGHRADPDAWTNAVLVLAGAILSLYTGWKNNNVTYAAQLAQCALDAAKGKGGE